MPDEFTQNDSLRFYHTGAASDGAAQDDPDASLGLYRAGDEVEFLAVSVTNPFSNVTIDHVDGANSAGTGSISAESVDSLAWTPPDGTKGAPVAIANGETKILQGGGGELNKSVRVTRTDANNLSGTATLTLTEIFNSVFGGANLDEDQAAAGLDRGRCFAVKNGSANEVKNVKFWAKQIGTAQVSDSDQLGASGAGTLETSGSFADWDDTGYCYIYESDGTTLREVVYYESRTDTVLTVPAAGREALLTSASAGASDDIIKCGPGLLIGKEAPSAQPDGYYEDETGDETGVPSAVVSWEVGVNEADGIDIGDLDAGEQYGVRFRWIYPAGVLSDSNVQTPFNSKFEAA